MHKDFRYQNHRMQYKITVFTMLKEILKRLENINKEGKVIINDISD